MTCSQVVSAMVSPKSRAALGALLGLCLLAGHAPKAGAASAAPLVVTRTADDTRSGSLRYAIAQASATGGTVTFAIPATDPGVANGYATITISLGPLIIPSSLSITGPAAPATPVAVSGPPDTGSSGLPPANASRVFSITGGTVALSNLLIEFGNASADNQRYPEAEGGGGILNTASLTLTNCSLEENVTGDALNPGVGAGINNSGAGASLTLINCTVEGNVAQYVTSGTGIANSGTLLATGCSIFNNEYATSGAGLSNTGTAALTDCTINSNYGNSTAGGGGGVYNAGSLTLNACTVSGNSAGGYYIQVQGGGLWNTGSLTMNGCAVSGNSTGGVGGGLANDGTLAMNACTISENSAREGGGLSDSSTGLAQITNCLFVQNIAANAGGMTNTGALTLINSTFTGNITTTGNGLFGASGLLSGPATLLNDIFYFDTNTATGGAIVGEIGAAFGTAGPTVTYSDVQGGYAGAGNINLDPLFVQNPIPAVSYTPANPGDEHLKLISPAAHSGTNGPGVPLTDIEGTPRPAPPATPSMGAYEIPSTGGGFVAAGGFVITVNQGQNTGTQAVARFFPGATPGTSFAATVDFGDGTGPAPGTVSPDPNTPGAFDVTGSHTYAASGAFTITVVITGPGGTPTATVTSTANSLVATDVTSQVGVYRGGLIFNRATRRFVQTVTLENYGTGPLNGLLLVLDNLPPGVTLLNQAGTTQYALPSGSPYLSLPGTLSVGYTVTIVLQLTYTGSAPLGYTPRVLTGPGAR